MMLQSHQTPFDREFDEILTDVQTMARKVEQAIKRSMKALYNNDTTLANQIIAEDAEINELRYKVESGCLALIATQQPTAGDLRAVIAAIHIVVEIERMGDHVKGIAKTVIMMEEEPLLKTYKKIRKMGNLSYEMLNGAVEAFIERDAEKAQVIAMRDPEMDNLYHAVFNKLVKVMAHNPEQVTRATYLMWCSHNLERIADRVTNIAERVIFMATGTFGDLDNVIA
jgi:phosphate transport system protein